MNITSVQFYSYLYSNDFFIDLTACVKESSTKQVDTVMTSIVDIVDAPESFKTQDVHGNFPCDGYSTGEVDLNVGFDVDTHHVDVINDGAFVSGRNTGEDVLMKMQPSKYVVEKDRKETTPIDDPATDYSRNPNGEYDPDNEDIDIPNVLVDECDSIRHLDKSNGGGKPPYKLGAQQVKQERKEH